MCQHKSFLRGTKCSQIFGLAGPAQNILGSVIGQGRNEFCLIEHIFYRTWDLQLWCAYQNDVLQLVNFP